MNNPADRLRPCRRDQSQVGRWRIPSDIGSLAAGAVLAAAGFMLLAYLGKDYPICQAGGRLSVSHHACTVEGAYHWAGIALMLIAMTMIFGGVLAAGRRSRPPRE